MWQVGLFTIAIRADVLLIETNEPDLNAHHLQLQSVSIEENALKISALSIFIHEICRGPSPLMDCVSCADKHFVVAGWSSGC
jgi:hypothetical protein